MNKKIVIRKIIEFLEKHLNFKEECEVVYILTEIRKLIEESKENRKKYKALYFYCCWAMHIRLTQSSAKYISDIFNKNINTKCMEDLKRGMKMHNNFFKLEDFKIELMRFFEENNLRQTILIEDKKWKHFKKLFQNVIAECPIKLFGNFKSLQVGVIGMQLIYRFVFSKYFKNNKGEDRNIVKIKINY